MPDAVTIALERFPTKRWFGTPLRCYNCQQYGHHSSRCANQRRCGKCAADHDDKTCNKTRAESICANCQEGHPAWSPQCIHYQKAYAIRVYSMTQEVSYFKAKIHIESSSTYADIVKKGKNKVDAQTQMLLSGDGNKDR